MEWNIGIYLEMYDMISKNRMFVEVYCVQENLDDITREMLLMPRGASLDTSSRIELIMYIRHTIPELNSHTLKSSTI